VPPILLFVMFAAMLSAWPALAHDWYPQQCCSDRDCAPLAAERVKVTPEAYIIDGIHRVAHNMVRWSPDEQYHGCLRGNPPQLFCFWAPRMSW
jgi:hypothetical protein